MAYSPSALINNSGPRVMEFMRKRLTANGMYEVIAEDKTLDIHEHLPFLKSIAEGNILEVGVHCGISTTALLAGLEDKLLTGRGGHLWSIDVHPSCRYIWYGHHMWTFYCPWSGDIPAPKVPLDLLFIDGDHSYEQVMLDLEDWVPKVKQGGMVLCHDADAPSFPGVRKAIDEYCYTNNMKHELRKGSNGLEVIYV